MRTHGKKLNNFDRMDCEVLMFEVKTERLCFCTLQNKIGKPWILLAWLFVSQKVEVFGIMLENWVENP